MTAASPLPLYPLAGGEGAMGAILLPLAPGETVDPATLAARLGDGAVEVNGRAVDAGDFPLILAGALATEGGYVGREVRGRAALSRRARGRAPAHRRSLAALALGGGGGFLLALLAGVQRFLPGLLRSRPSRAAPGSRAAPVSAHFAPLPLQEDMTATEGRTRPRASAPRWPSRWV